MHAARLAGAMTTTATCKGERGKNSAALLGLLVGLLGELEDLLELEALVGAHGGLHVSHPGGGETTTTTANGSRTFSTRFGGRGNRRVGHFVSSTRKELDFTPELGTQRGRFFYEPPSRLVVEIPLTSEIFRPIGVGVDSLHFCLRGDKTDVVTVERN